jgi:HK97 gp10 family phage protein
MVVETRITGLPDLKAALAGIAPKLRRRALRNALSAGARVVRDEAKRNAPMANKAYPNRTIGLLRKSIAVRTSKTDRKAGDVGVFVNVRPAKKGARGAKSRLDPFYWLFQNFGWTPASGPNTRAAKRARRKASRAGSSPSIPGKHFLEAGGKRLSDALRIFVQKIGPQIQKLNGGKDVQL